MEYLYMGLFSKVFNWVLDKILSPVFTFVSNLISTVLSWLFNNILAPLLKEVLWPLIEMAVDLIVGILAGVIYEIYAKVLSFVDYMNIGFDYMIGLKKVTYIGKETTLLELFIMDLPQTARAFWTINFIGLALAFLFTVYSVTKSSLDFEFENKRPVSKVLSAFFKCVVGLLTVQLFVYLVVKLSGVILEGIDLAIGQMLNQRNEVKAGTIGSIIFCVSSFNAAKASQYNLAESSKGVGVTDALRQKFYEGTVSYTDVDAVKKDFILKEFDYVIGFALAVFMVVVMAACLIVFVQRLFDLLMLYIVSPYFVAMMPLDDGQRFGKWREMFIGKVFSGFGMVMAMKLYLMLCPLIMGNNVVFDESSTEMDYAAKIIFLLGGAWAVLKSGTIITNLISAEAGGQETETARVTTAAAMAVGGAAATGIGAGVRGIGNHFKGKIAQKRADSKQKFNDTRYNPQLQSAEAPASVSGAGNNLMQAAGGESGINAAGIGAGSEAASNQPQGYFAKQDKGELIASGFGGRRDYKKKDGSVVHGFHFGGSFLGIKHDGSGTKISFLGASVKLGDNGKVMSWSLPCRAAKFKLGSDGKLHCSKISVLGSKVTANTETGKLQFTDCKLLGMHREVDEKGNANLTSLFGFKREKQENGEYRLTSAPGGIFQRSYTKKEDGSLELAGLRVFGVNLMINEEVAGKNRKRGKKE